MRAVRNVRDVSKAQVLCSIKRYNTLRCPHCGKKARVPKNLVYDDDARVHCSKCDQSYLLKDNIVGEE
jgi:transposase-like protein